MKLPILVTGGAGHIGAHCCNALADAGFVAITYDNLSTGHTDFVKWGPPVVGDVRNCASVNRAISDHKAAAVVHLAAASLVGESVVDPEKYYSHNVEGSLSVLRAFARGRLQPYGFLEHGRCVRECRQRGAIRAVAVLPCQSVRSFQAHG
jgi:UDP-glucose 4-epimerase